MTHRQMRHACAALASIGLSLLTTNVSAQGPFQTITPEALRVAAAKPTPRTPDGKPDFNGSWDRGTIAIGSGPLLKPAAAPARTAGQAPARPPAAAPPGPRPEPDRPKYKPEFQAKVKDLSDRQVMEDPAFHCYPPGVPRIGPPVQIVQTPRQVVFMYDDLSGNFFRLIPTDGRPHRTDVEPGYLGDAVGHWEGDTLVVETTNFNDETWLIDNGAFHTTNLRVIERLRRVGDTLEYNVRVEDPEVLAEPWVRRTRNLIAAPWEIAESPRCVEKDAGLIVDLTHHDNPR